MLLACVLSRLSSSLSDAGFSPPFLKKMLSYRPKYTKANTSHNICLKSDMLSIVDWNLYTRVSDIGRLKGGHKKKCCIQKKKKKKKKKCTDYIEILQFMVIFLNNLYIFVWIQQGVVLLTWFLI